MEIGLTHYLILSAALFVISVIGIFVHRRNIVLVLMSLELLLIAVAINLVAFSSYLGSLDGQVFTLLIVVASAAQFVVGLSVLVAFHRSRGSTAVEDMTMMKG